ncbi:MAG: menaquinol-cytochrome c reductase iron-sulfur subunit precursor [Mycobacterium sp.]|nr:menaquinol-cytochrome c reductase iron-sulfur subunit precursor [Mycobacterium sp.]
MSEEDKEPRTAAEAEGSVVGRWMAGTPGSDDERAAQGAPHKGDGEDLVAGGQLATPVANDSAATARPGAGHAQPPGGVVPAAGGTAPFTHDRDARADRRAERRVTAWFLLTVVATVLYLVVYFAQRPGDSLDFGIFTVPYNGELGFCMGAALTFVGVGAIDWAKNLVPHELAVQEREPFASSAREREALERTFSQGVEASGFQRRGMVRRSFLGAMAVVPLPLIVFFRGLGKLPEKDLFHTSWTPGARLVGEDGSPVKSDALSVGAIMTVFPEGHTDTGDSPAILIRLEPGVNQPVKGREGYAWFNHVAYSKICTHAGCPVSLYEQQTHHLLCPCHQSTFLATHGAKPIFGPATRSLPQLAIDVDSDGYFIAKHDFEQPIGPGFWEHK